MVHGIVQGKGLLQVHAGGMQLPKVEEAGPDGTVTRHLRGEVLLALRQAQQLLAHLTCPAVLATVDVDRPLPNQDRKKLGRAAPFRQSSRARAKALPVSSAAQPLRGDERPAQGRLQLELCRRCVGPSGSAG